MESGMGNGTIVTAWDSSRRAWPSRASHHYWWGCPHPPRRQTRGCHDPLSQAILPVHMVGVKLQLNCLPDKSALVARFSTEDSGILEFNEVTIAEPTFCHCSYTLVAHMKISQNYNTAESTVTFQCSLHLCRHSSSTLEQQHILPPSTSCCLWSAATGTVFFCVLSMK